MHGQKFGISVVGAITRPLLTTCQSVCGFRAREWFAQFWQCTPLLFMLQIMAARREQDFYSTLVSVFSVDILPNFETKSQIKKTKRSCRSLAIANVASERKWALIEIIRKSSRLLVIVCLRRKKKKCFCC